jgi:pilus assembly protein CpaC
VIIVTTYIVRPVPAYELSKPDDNYNAASDSAGMFLGEVNRIYGGGEAKGAEKKYHGTVGYIYK